MKPIIKPIWKCSKSPTKAHFWIIGTVTQYCKYCGEKRVRIEPIHHNIWANKGFKKAVS